MSEQDVSTPGSGPYPPSPIRVLVVDDQPIVRRGVAACLAAFEDLEFAGEAVDGEQAVWRCSELQPDVVLMDLVMPGIGGIEATRAITARWPHIRVIALTSFEDEDRVQDAWQAGVTAYLLKNVLGDELVAAIRAAAAGRPTFSAEVRHG